MTMKTKRLQLMIMATLFLGVNIGGASVAQGATLQNKNVVVAKKPTPKSTVSSTNVSKVNTTKKSSFSSSCNETRCKACSENDF